MSFNITDLDTNDPLYTTTINSTNNNSLNIGLNAEVISIGNTGTTVYIAGVTGGAGIIGPTGPTGPGFSGTISELTINSQGDKSGALEILSGSTANYVSSQIGRVNGELEFGVAATPGQFFIDSASGDVVFRVLNSENYMLFGVGTGISLLTLNGYNAIFRVPVIASFLQTNGNSINSISKINTTNIEGLITVCSNRYNLGDQNNGILNGTWNILTISGTGYRWGATIEGIINLEANTGDLEASSRMQTAIIKFIAAYSQADPLDSAICSTVAIVYDTTMYYSALNNLSYNLTWVNTNLVLSVFCGTYPETMVWNAKFDIITNQNTNYLANNTNPTTVTITSYAAYQ